MRDVISLDGDWIFRHETDQSDRVAIVPMPWQAQFADLRHTSGRATYRRRFARPRGEAVLRFGAVSYLAEVLVNGIPVGQHEGGYLPFDCPVPAAILHDTNEVEVRCLAPDGSPNDAGIAFAEIPHGKQSWYGPIGGIWQSVTLEGRDPTHLTHCAIRADMGGRIDVTLTLPEAALGADLTLRIAGSPDATLRVTGPKVQVRLNVESPALWSPEAPNLHDLEVTLSRGTVLDQTRHSFGFRSISTRDGQLILNGRPYYMLAALDQDYYPEGICTPPSLAFLEDQVRKAKALGLNMLRCHIKVPDPRYYAVADRLGILIWTEVPNVGRFTDASAHRMKQTMEGIVARDGNHPSIVIWSLINEGWGIDLAHDAGQRRWLAEAYDGLKTLDPSRLVCDNSPSVGNFHVKGDLDDYHYYRSVPERRDEWDQLTREFAQGAPWTWTPHGDGIRRGDEPKLVSEFGVWGLPQPGQVRIGGAEPWWMDTGRTWGEGAAHPLGIEARFDRLGLSQVFGSLEQFITAAQWYQFANLKYEIEQIRAWPQIQGYVITEFTDVHWESNGLLDMNRNPRVFHDRFAQINADVVIVPKVSRYSGLSGQDWACGLAIASGARSLAAGVLRWACDGQVGEMAFPGAAPLSVTDLGPLALTLPRTDANRMLTIDFALVLGGEVIQRNQVDLALFAPRQLQDLPRVAAQDKALARRAVSLGYPLVAVEEADLVLTHALTEADLRRMQTGARYLVFADGSPDATGLDAAGCDLGLTARHGTLWRGDWIAGFSWIKRVGALADLPGGPLLDLSFSDVVPHHVMTGWAEAEFAHLVDAGLVVGWVQKPAALIAWRPVGQGGLLAATFRVMRDQPAQDAVADAIFDALVAQACTHR